jgi:hypothetical protein
MSAIEIWDIMTKAQEKLIKSIRSRNFEKFNSVAYKDNGEKFFYKVRLRFVSFWFTTSCFILVSYFLTLSYVAD